MIVADSCVDCHALRVIVIGDGPEYIKADAAKNTLDNLLLIKSVEFDELHRYYALADAYIHPGSEPFSLAFVEAAIAGIPLISTHDVGASSDYLIDGYNGISDTHTSYAFCKRDK